MWNEMPDPLWLVVKSFRGIETSQNEIVAVEMARAAMAGGYWGRLGARQTPSHGGASHRLCEGS
jgi:hypothetical protein